MLFWSPALEHLPAAADALRAGRLVGLPTETVYGLAGNALDPSAVAAIFTAKGRPTFDPLIVHCPSTPEAFRLASSVPPAARLLADHFWPGPLTLVLPRRPDLPDLLSAGLPTLALRVPAHPVALALLHEAALPLAAPSANRFGHISPTSAEHVLSELGDRPEVAGVLDAGPCALGLESTVIGFPSPGRVRVYRIGGTPIEALREVIDSIEIVQAADRVDDPSLAERGEVSPGMLARHYAPRTPLLLLDPQEPPPSLPGTTAWLCFDHPPHGLAGPSACLSPTRDLPEAATRLFSCLRHLDSLAPDRIVAWRVPNIGLGRAINDRLTRASFS